MKKYNDLTEADYNTLDSEYGEVFPIEFEPTNGNVVGFIVKRPKPATVEFCQQVGLNAIGADGQVKDLESIQKMNDVLVKDCVVAGDYSKVERGNDDFDNQIFIGLTQELGNFLKPIAAKRTTKFGTRTLPGTL